jgi:hypothetical protein
MGSFVLPCGRVMHRATCSLCLWKACVPETSAYLTLAPAIVLAHLTIHSKTARLLRQFQAKTA